MHVIFIEHFFPCSSPESLPVGCVGEVNYDPSITNYHSLIHACWNKGQKLVSLLSAAGLVMNVFHAFH